MGQKIIGGPTRPTNDVHLAKRQDGIGDSLSVHLSQNQRSAAVWTLEIWVHTQQGSFILGTGSTIPPTLGSRASRTVAIANCPGATGWHVVATSATAGETAELVLDSSKCCSSTPGVTMLDGGGASGEPVPWLNIFSIALANSFQIIDAPCVLRSITVRVDSTLATATYYVQLWNASALPADATVVTLANSMMAPEKVQHVLGVDNEIRIDFNENGVNASNGAFLCLSSTEFTKTLVAGSFMSVISAEFSL